MTYNSPGQDEKPLGRSKHRWNNNINVFNVTCLGKMKGHSRDPNADGRIILIMYLKKQMKRTQSGSE
jgi:hypothetical protein